jgi:NTP pyrophosphatase (non-canonical NTP hydrolase)
MMNLYEYQQRAIVTAVYPKTYSISYPALGLAEEAGEVAGKIAKMMRDKIKLEDQKEKIEAEMGDVLWMLAALAHDCGLSLQVIAEKNVQKLQARQQAGTLHGEGDNR